jgi:hypothetical protein
LFFVQSYAGSYFSHFAALPETVGFFRLIHTLTNSY